MDKMMTLEQATAALVRDGGPGHRTPTRLPEGWMVTQLRYGWHDPWYLCAPDGSLWLRLEEHGDEWTDCWVEERRR